MLLPPLLLLLAKLQQRGGGVQRCAFLASGPGFRLAGVSLAQHIARHSRIDRL